MNILCVSVISLVLFGLPVCAVFVVLGRSGSPSVLMERVRHHQSSGDRRLARGILAATPSCRPRPDLTTTDREPITLNISLACLGLYGIPE